MPAYSACPSCCDFPCDFPCAFCWFQMHHQAELHPCFFRPRTHTHIHTRTGKAGKISKRDLLSELGDGADKGVTTTGVSRLRQPGGGGGEDQPRPLLPRPSRK